MPLLSFFAKQMQYRPLLYLIDGIGIVFILLYILIADYTINDLMS